MKNISITVLILFLMAGCKEKMYRPIICKDMPGISQPPVISVRKIMNVDTFQNRVVTIKGRFAYNFEDVALYNDDYSKAVWLDFNEDISRHDTLLSQLSGKNVVLTGFVDYLRKGHLNYYYFTLADVFCIKKEE